MGSETVLSNVKLDGSTLPKCDTGLEEITNPDTETTSFLIKGGQNLPKLVPHLMQSPDQKSIKQNAKEQSKNISCADGKDDEESSSESENNNIENGTALKESKKQKKKKVRTGFLGQYLGIILALITSIVLPLTGLIVKSLTQYHPLTLAGWRFQGILFPSIIITFYHRVIKKEFIFDSILPLSAPGRLRNIGFLGLRGILGSTALILFFYSLRYISVADATVISSSSPVFVTFVAHIFLGEKCGIVQLLVGVIALFGVGVISRPPILTGETDFDRDTLIGASLSLACMFVATLVYVIMRYLRQLHYSVPTLAFGLWGTTETLLLCLLVSPFKLPEGTQDWLLALGLAIGTFMGQNFMTLAFKFEQAGVLSLVRTADVVFAFIWQFLLLGVIPDRFSVIGASIVAFGIFVVGLRKYVEEMPEKNKIRKKLRWLLK